MLTRIHDLLTFSEDLLRDESVWGGVHRQWVHLRDWSDR